MFYRIKGYIARRLINKGRVVNQVEIDTRRFAVFQEFRGNYACYGKPNETWVTRYAVGRGLRNWQVVEQVLS